MTGATLFSGIGAPEVALPFIDWKWCAEIEKFPSAVLKFRHPHIPNLGDITRETFVEDARRYGPIDLICAGSPCQDFSVAGERKGMDGASGNLALRFIEIVDALRPRWLLFENVPGLLSSTSHKMPDSCRVFLEARREGEFGYDADEGSDFGHFLAALSECGYSGAYASLDAQYFGLAQRRERVFVVCHSGGWTPAASVLFDLESLQGNTAPCREAGENFTHGLAGSLTSSGRGVERPGDSRGQDPIVAVSFGGNNTSGPIELATACNAHGGTGRTDFMSETFVTVPTLDASFARLQGCSGHGHLVPVISDTIRSHTRPASNSANVIPILEPGARTGSSTDDPRAGIGIGESGDPMYTLSGKQHAIAFDTTQVTSAANRSNPKDGDPCHPLASRAHAPAVATKMTVRRLTVIECARLQGFPDTFTHIPWKRRKIAADEAAYLQRHGLECWQEKEQWYTKVASDGPQYKAYGNAMAVPVIRWIGERIRQVDEILEAR